MLTHMTSAIQGEASQRSLATAAHRHQEIDIAAWGPVYGLGPQEIFLLLILFCPRASMQEFLANMRRPS